MRFTIKNECFSFYKFYKQTQYLETNKLCNCHYNHFRALQYTCNPFTS